VKTLFKRVIIILLLGLIWPGPVLASQEPYLTSPSAIVIDRSCNGQVLYERQARKEREPASTTKIMTAILALELGDLKKPVRVSDYAATTPGASIYLRSGEIMKLGELVKGALINSGNDAAVAIAEFLAGSEDRFAWLMNRKAKQLGANHTSFRNPHGLSEPDHYSCAYDLAVIASYAMGNKTFSEIVTTGAAQIPSPYGVRHLYNTNRLLDSYPGCNGIKTGTTDAAGQCLVASAVQGNRQLISVVLGSVDRYSDTRALLDYGFNEFYAEIAEKDATLGRVYVKNGEVSSVPVKANTNIGFSVPKEQARLLEKRVYLPAYIKAPVEKGQELGEVVILFNKEKVASSALVAQEDVQALPWWLRLFND